ncbi:histidine kinase dimerization/phospho-acceptor domain-containing protein [Pontibacter sp. SGAir0037]|uniref:histidine kinase dimerization/phospho-acceptor domain-containing protein n=1 Tax=Pontibacter sp. SGAir0037 TaxID=2571030 RepID=UPI0010CCCD81|nr:histidine kinase dimerization/phospho-acceptor domain-containing protein [Pontibacter sp. SGAir0037]QCR24679.1 hypothetical protein C1N53_21530 [Pontibacter sp. SGAir0037]
MIPITNFIRSDFKAIHPYTGIQLIKGELADKGAMVVLEEDTQAFIGLLTPLDLVRKPHLLVVDCLSSKPLLKPDSRLGEALGLMQETRQEVLAVVNNEEMKGLVFKNDLVQYLSTQKAWLERKRLEELNIIAHQQVEIEKALKIEKALYHSTKSARILLSTDGTILFLNKIAFESCTDAHRKLLAPGANLRDVAREIPHLVGNDFEGDFNRALQGKHMRMEHEAAAGDTKRWFKIEYNPVTVEQGLLGVSIVATDIHERKQNELLLDRHSQLLQELIYTQSHVLRRPVANILGLVNLISRKALLLEENKVFLDLLEASTRELDEIIKDIVNKASQLE